MMKQYNLYNLIAGWVTFVISAVVYLLTIGFLGQFLGLR